MRGFPKLLNTKQDYLNCITDFPQETKNATIINKKATRSIMPKIFKEFLLKKADRNVVNRDVRRVSTPAQKP